MITVKTYRLVILNYHFIENMNFQVRRTEIFGFLGTFW